MVHLRAPRVSSVNWFIATIRRTYSGTTRVNHSTLSALWKLNHTSALSTSVAPYSRILSIRLCVCVHVYTLYSGIVNLLGYKNK